VIARKKSEGVFFTTEAAGGTAGGAEEPLCVLMLSKANRTPVLSAKSRLMSTINALPPSLPAATPAGLEGTPPPLVPVLEDSQDDSLSIPPPPEGTAIPERCSTPVSVHSSVSRDSLLQPDTDELPSDKFRLYLKSKEFLDKKNLSKAARQFYEEQNAMIEKFVKIDRHDFTDEEEIEKKSRSAKFVINLRPAPGKRVRG